MTWDGPTLWYAAARWLGYLAVFVVVGAAVFRWWILPRAVRDGGGDPTGPASRAATGGRAASVLLALALLGRLYWQSRSMIEPEEPLTGEIVRLVLAGAWGRGWLAQAGAALLALIGWRLVGRANQAPGRWLALAGALGLVLAGPLVGHAVGLPAAGSLGYPATVVHLGAGAIWLGTLGVIGGVALRSGGTDPVPVPALLAAFSPIALASGLAAMAAGTVVAWRYLGTVEALWTTAYGQALLLKIATLLVVAATGGYNWRVVLPRLRAGQSAPIGVTASLEIGVGVLLLAVTAVLVSLGAPVELSE